VSDKTDSQVVFDLFTTAIEGGINGWARVDHYRWRKPGSAPDGSVEETQDVEGFEARIFDTESEFTYRINAEVIRAGVARAVSALSRGDLDGLLPYHRTALLLASAGVRWDDPSFDFDADTADIVVQFGTIGELVYG